MKEDGPVTPAHRLSLLTAEPTWRGRALSGRAVDLLAVLAGGEHGCLHRSGD